MSPVAAFPPSPPADAGLPSSEQLSAALDAFVRDNAERARFWVRRLHVPDQDAGDVVQDALVVLCERLDEVTPSAWLPWLRAAVEYKEKQRRRDYLRPEARRPRRGDRHPPPSTPPRPGVPWPAG